MMPLPIAKILSPKGNQYLHPDALTVGVLEPLSRGGDA